MHRSFAIRNTFAIMVRLLFAAVLASACALGQQPAQALHGTWIATAGKGEVFHGTWAGGALPGQPNLAEGTWTLTRAGQMVVEGTWRAEKSKRSWEGRWSGRTATGQSLGGAWGADLKNWHGKTLRQMLERTFVEEVAGWWQSGRMGGNWWLKGPRNPSSH